MFCEAHHANLKLYQEREINIIFRQELSSTFARHMASDVMFFRGKVLLMKYI